MLKFRSLDQSVRKTVVDLFTSPPSNTLLTAWNVYDEDQFRDDAFHPVMPYVFLLEKRARPKQTRLPLIILERGLVGYAPFELGTQNGSSDVYNLHVFGRNRGERSDLAAFLFDSLKRIDLYDFDTDPPTLKYTVSIEAKFAVPQDVREDVGLEGALLNFESVAFQLATKE